VLSKWMQRQQPCLFGRVAAANNWLHHCILTERDFQQRDEDIAERIRGEALNWKRRSIRPNPEFSVPAHGFLLTAVSPRLAYASPDENLREFASRIRDLWGCPGTQEKSGTMHWETLYLAHPADGTYRRFTFGVDFFAVQGDKRWWHDHRVPGGIAFTANSVGHMRRYREWYSGMGDQREWTLKTAMGTIDLAAETPYGKATWLKPLGPNGQPVVERLRRCPFSKPEGVKPSLRDKDWTRYGGYLHTDHSIRSEFFFERPDLSPDISRQQYLEDFTYLYDPTAKDYIRFIEGEVVSQEEVFAKLGPPEDWGQIVGPAPTRRSRGGVGEFEEIHPEVEALLQKCEPWSLNPQDLDSISR